mmetsp:Transcript_20206/g.48144  ORF Transcript_20206/g.48144 Transcript_20206/m.48144 type:complete len:98 (+) Transcript_20206:1000-1293(+)
MDFLLYFSTFFKGVDEEIRKPSGGFLGVFLALRLCASVAVYGFDQGSTYYFMKGFQKLVTRTGVKMQSMRGRHAWEQEKRCLGAYEKAFGSRFRVLS